PKPELATQANAAAIPLVDFTPYIADPDEEFWAYGASWKVMESIVDKVGAQAMIEIIDAAERGEYSYLGDGEPETTRITPGTRRFLDLIENTPGVEHDSVTDLFNNWVFGQDDPSAEVDRVALTERPEARTRYFDLVDRGDGWAAPVGIRAAMTFWRFDEANDLMAEAEDAITRKEELIELTRPVEAELPVKLEQLYEAADDDYGQFTTA
ncbi:MAG: hypothetical protein GY724_20000, partial [Actinomycetia bacterium]|nr:hypothetical protein [Actinomycetes bacterium]